MSCNTECRRNIQDYDLIQTSDEDVTLLSHLIETRRPVVMSIEAGNILTNATTCCLVLRRDVDLILKHTMETD